MERGDDGILRPEQARYLARLQPAADEIVTALEEEAGRRGVEACAAATASLAAVLVRAVTAQRILELGTGLGRATLALATAGGAGVTSVDRDAALQSVAHGFLERAGAADRVELVTGEAVEVVPRLEGPFDLVMIDVDKRDDRRCLDLVLMLLRVGGVVIVDRLLWRGRVAEPADEVDESADAAHAFNAYFSAHPQLGAVVLPLDDGVGVAVKLRPLVTDVGGPF